MKAPSQGIQVPLELHHAEAGGQEGQCGQGGATRDLVYV